MWRQWFERQWQYKGWAQCVLLPLSGLFALLAGMRRLFYHLGVFSSTRLPVPVIVIGNISVGGVGKTPLVIYLAQQLRAAGYYPGILSRGYGGQQTGEVSPTSDPAQYGDEPVLIAHRSACPVWVNPLRADGGHALLKIHPQINVLLCDDGLQHYALQRDIEIAVVQRPYGLGNNRLLPAGPLRESLGRLYEVDLIVETGELPQTISTQKCFKQSLQYGNWLSVSDFSIETTVDKLRQHQLLAVAGIGHPQRFFRAIQIMGFECETKIFPDHYAYTIEDFKGVMDKTILMTEKDAVKCRDLGLTNAWFLPVSAELVPSDDSQTFTDSVISLLKQYERNAK